jgi:hypothetical protein
LGRARLRAVKLKVALDQGSAVAHVPSRPKAKNRHKDKLGRGDGTGSTGSGKTPIAGAVSRKGLRRGAGD